MSDRRPEPELGPMSRARLDNWKPVHQPAPRLGLRIRFWEWCFRHPTTVLAIVGFGIVVLWALTVPGCCPTRAEIKADMDATVQAYVSAAVVDLKHTVTSTAGRDVTTGLTANGIATIIGAFGVLLGIWKYGYRKGNWIKKAATNCTPLKG